MKRFRFRLDQVLHVRRVQEDQARFALLAANRDAQLAAARQLPGVTGEPTPAQVKTAADFKGRTIADSAGFSTRRYLTDYLIARAGLPPGSYTPAPAELS